MTIVKNERTKESLKHLAAEFLRRESNRQSLITVTDVILKERGARATILYTVLPEKEEGAALAFLNRNRGEVRRYISEHLRIQRLPVIDFAVDTGEKNRQKIEALSHNG